MEFDYKNDPEAYELEERSRPDEMAMLRRVGEWCVEILDGLREARVLDLCCGTGLSFEAVAKHPNLSLLLGVDNCFPYLRFAREIFPLDRYPLFLVQGDAVDLPLPEGSWDLIILASAYHHIEDDRKLRFLKRVRRLLKPGGSAVVAENVLPSYEAGNEESYRAAVRVFYEHVLEDARRSDPELPYEVEQLIWRVAKYGFDGEYEYKTDYETLRSCLRAAGLKIEAEERVWPQKGNIEDSLAGNYVVVVEPSQEEGGESWMT